jgi:ATP-dependent DNA ligase
MKYAIQGPPNLLNDGCRPWLGSLRTLIPRFKLKVRAAYLDGEIAVLTPEGISDFGALQEVLGRHGGSRELAFIVFDLLHLDGRDLRPLPPAAQKAMREKLLAELPGFGNSAMRDHLMAKPIISCLIAP